ncbi:hypothetical protein Tco_0433529, partial [Tanacetum coccineum]
MVLKIKQNYKKKVTNFVKQQLQEKSRCRRFWELLRFSSFVKQCFQKNTNVGGGGSGNYGGSHGLSSKNYRKNGNIGGFGSSRGHVGSKSMGSAGGSG